MKLKTFEVTVIKTVMLEQIVTVKASDFNQAALCAFKQVKDDAWFERPEVEYSTDGVYLIEPDKPAT